jgi:hypothetical protein
MQNHVETDKAQDARRRSARAVASVAGSPRPDLRHSQAAKLPPLRLLVVGLGGLALTGCATTRYATSYCVTRAQLEQLKQSQPAKVRDQLTGQADRDTQILAGNLIRLRAHDDGLLTVLGGCVDPNK